MSDRDLIVELQQKIASMPNDGILVVPNETRRELAERAARRLGKTIQIVIISVEMEK